MEGMIISEQILELCRAFKNRDFGMAINGALDLLNPNSKCPDSGLTLLMLACGFGYYEPAKWLLEHGADPNCCDSQAGAFPLHKACQGGHLEIVKLLAEHGAQLDCQCSATGHTPLMEAVWFKYADIVDFLLQQNVKLNIPTHYGFTLEEHITYELKVNEHPDEQAKIKAIQDLVNQRKARDQVLQRDNPLMDAVIKDDLQTLDSLLKEGFPVDKRAPCIGSFNDDHTPLLVAVRDGHFEAAKRLLAAGADANAVEPTFLAVPLHKATYNGRVNMTNLLLRQPGIKLNYQGPTNGYTPLHDALWHGFETCAMLLIDAGADLDLRGHDGKRPIDLAAEVFGSDSSIYNHIRMHMAL